MPQNKNIRPTNKLRLVIIAALLFILYSSYSQNYKMNRSPFTLDIKGGMNIPGGDFKDYAKSGFQAGVMLNKGVYKNLAVGLNAEYNHFGLKDELISPDDSWRNISFAIGPQYTIAMSMFFVELYAHIGMSLLKTPSITKDAPNLPDYTDKYDKGFFNTFDLEGKNTTSLHTDLGIKVGAQISSKIRLFVGSSYNTSLDSPIKYKSRDISKAFHPSGEIDIDMVRSTPYEENSFALSSFNVNVGISINLGSSSTSRYAQDHNSIRSNRPSPIAWNDIVNNGDTIPRPAQDYNSSRSNRPSPIAWIVDTSGNDTVPKPVYAQDHNSSRSNRPSPIAWNDIVNNGDTIPRPAQDYNSSRSNRPSPIAWIVDTSGNDTVPKPVYAQDHNSSRSNRPSPIAWNDIVNDGDTIPRPAQDYNSSRSNRPSPIAWIVDTSGNDTVPKPVYAQDHNSSRSNRPSPIRIIDDINDIDNEEDDVVIVGRLITIDLKARSFELIDKNKQKIKGLFQAKVTSERMRDLKHDFLNKPANIHVKIKKTKLKTGKKAVSYEL